MAARTDFPNNDGANGPVPTSRITVPRGWVGGAADGRAAALFFTSACGRRSCGVGGGGLKDAAINFVRAFGTSWIAGTNDAGEIAGELATVVSANSKSPERRSGEPSDRSALSADARS